ncbi:MAG: GNAT family N-acetyltransferase [Planctomycetota bacterium]|nr:GNAT family N-acetyltransferase [Planctomycetota bacterium]
MSDPSIVRRTERLILRHLRQQDVDRAMRVWCTPEVIAFMPAGKNPEKLRRHIEEEVAVPYDQRPAINYLACFIGAEMVGDVGLVEKEVDGTDEVELVYVVHPDHWGQGYATEAARAMCQHAFGTLGLDRLIALIKPGNASSIRVAEKAGFVLERDTVRPSGITMHVYSRERPAAS